MSSSSRVSAGSETSETSETTTSTGDGGRHGDGVVPTEDELWDTQYRSQRQWACLLRRARETQKRRLQPRSIRPEQLLHLVPDLPRDLQNVHAIAGRASWQRQLCASDGDGLSTTTTRMEAERRWRLSLPSGRPTLCFLSRESPFTYADQPANALAPLFLAWAYILSTALLERQGIAVQYAASACHPSHRADQVDIDIGKASTAERHWWRALVAPGHGWLPLGKERPPWTVVYKGDVCMRIEADAPDTVCFTGALDASNTPPSSEQAVRYLTRFAALHGLDDQAMLALTMALVLPLLNESRSEVALPRPCGLSRQPCQTRREAAPTPCIHAQGQNLGHYMTLSSHTLFVSSALWGIFWEPGVACNHVSAWMRPVHDLVLPLVQDGHIETLAQFLARRCPAVAPLWYGILACGPFTTIVRGLPRFLATLQTPSMSRPLPEVAVWTRSPQSFMDQRGSGPYLLALPTSSTEPCRVQRQDVWRLRHELYNATEPCSEPFRNPPLCPWPPFGTMGEDEVEPSVRAHLRCDRHIWEYVSWTWIVQGREPYADRGRACIEASLPCSGSNGRKGSTRRTEEYTAPPTKPPQPLELDQAASQQAVGDIFRWTASEMEPSGKNIYQHPWVQASLDLEDMEEEEETAHDGPPSPTKIGERKRLVEEWFAGQKVAGRILYRAAVQHLRYD